jgi:DNA-binding CsgD family transcriptional regulator
VAPDTIVGRQRELGTVKRFLDDASLPRTLLIEGEAGIGKTTIWTEAARLAGADGRLLTARPSESEAKLSFSVLTDLLAPTLSEVRDELPVPQVRALELALLLKAPAVGARVDARAVSLGTLGVLRSLAARMPLTIAIDDVHWIDAASSRSLAFALRRLVDESVTVVAARRVPGPREPIGLMNMAAFYGLRLGPLPVEAIAQSLHQVDGAFSRPLVKRIHEASGGNPFYALEIGRALTRPSSAHPRAGEPLPVPDDLQTLLRDRLKPLSAEARDALLVVAASPSPSADLVAAVTGSDIALEEAARAEIVTMSGSSVAFTHPLLASAVYADAAPSTRRGVHQRLAAVSTDLEQRARHLALSSTGADDEAASSLDRAAVQARARGAPQVAAELSELAVMATPSDDSVARQRRIVTQAGNLFDAGDPRLAREIIQELIPRLEPGPARAEARFMLSSFAWKNLRRVSELLHQALVEADRESLRSQILSDLAWVGLDMGELTIASDRAEAAVAVAEAMKDDPYPLRHALSILALTRDLLGDESGDQLERAVALQGTLTLADLSSPTTCLGRLLTWSSELDAAREALESELDRYREQGHETACYEILAHLADVEHRAGRFDRALRHLEEAEDIAAEAALDVFGEILPVRAAVAGSLGDLDDASRHAREGLAVCERTADRWNEIRCRSVLGFVEISRDDAAAAHRWLGSLPELTEEMGVREPGAFPFVPDAVEALVAIGELERATELTDRLEGQGVDRSRPLAIGTAARCRGTIEAARGDLPEAAMWLERSKETLRGLPHPFELSRTSLVAGEIERRMKQKSSARELLDASVAGFDRIGARVWAAKARRALARIGGRPPAPSDLSPSEEQVALLVADGRSNREVAASLFISVHTVEANLKRIYRKLGIRSRVELARKIGERLDAETYRSR